MFYLFFGNNKIAYITVNLYEFIPGISRLRTRHNKYKKSSNIYKNNCHSICLYRTGAVMADGKVHFMIGKKSGIKWILIDPWHPRSRSKRKQGRRAWLPHGHGLRPTRFVRINVTWRWMPDRWQPNSCPSKRKWREIVTIAPSMFLFIFYFVTITYLSLNVWLQIHFISFQPRLYFTQEKNKTSGN